MKTQMNKTSTLLFLILLALLLEMPFTAKSDVSLSQQKVDAFTRNVLPIDISKYNVTLDNYFVSNPIDMTRMLNNNVEEHYMYSLNSETSNLVVGYTVENNSLTTCLMSAHKGLVFSDHPYNNLSDAVTDFLVRYQHYSAPDTSEMIGMLQNTDASKNQTLLMGNLGLQIRNVANSFSGNVSSLIWYRVINGCNYLELSLSFSDGVFSGLSEKRDLYPIGDTSVNVSKDQAIATAMNYIRENYTNTAGGTWVKNYTIDQTKATATLLSSTANSNSQYPVWSFLLPLGHTSLGSIVALQVILSAGSGNILSCGSQLYGENSDPSDVYAALVPLESPDIVLPLPSFYPSFSPLLNEESSSRNLPATVAAISVVIAGVVVVAGLLVCFKKHNRNEV